MDGRLQIRSYDGKDGNKHYVTEVVANGVEFIERKGYTPGNGGEAGSGRSDMESFGSQVPFDEEIPF